MTGQATALPTIPIDHLSATQRASAAQVRSGITSCRCTALNDTGTLLPLIPQLQTCPNRSGRLTLSTSGRAVCRVSPEFVARDGAAMVWGVELLGAWPARTHHNRNQRFLLRLVLRRPIQFPKVCLTRRAFAGIGVKDLLPHRLGQRKDRDAGWACGKGARSCRQLSHRTTQTSRTPARNVLASLSKRVTIAR